MRLWRISDFTDLSGVGGLYASGRWHTRGRHIVYLADHPASALLEVLVRLEVAAADMPSIYRLLAIDVPDEIVVSAEGVGDRPDGWQDNFAWSRGIGDSWLIGGRSGLLRVPSAIVPNTFNWLLNPRHPEAARVTIAETFRAAFDPRLVRPH